MRDLIIVGASGHGKVLEDIANIMKQWRRIYFLDDDSQKNDNQIVGTAMDYPGYLTSCDFIVGIGNNEIRQKIHNLLENHNATFATLIHPFSSIGTYVKIGIGSVVMPGVVVNCNSSIGKGCIINTGSSVDHDCRIGNFVHVSPGATIGGSVVIKSRTWVGLGARLINNVCITDDCKIGAGAVVIRDIIDSGTYVGIPALKLKE